ncbi:MAG: APC family permease [Gammaproteobacteria bacterium]|nr:APC family permease [Gammaproteobacteria bacterium]
MNSPTPPGGGDGVDTALHRKAADDSRLRRDIGILGLLFAAVGSIIGSGWLFGALYAAQEAGPGSIIAWFVGGIMMMFIGLCYAELGTMFPVSGGVIRFPHYAFGSFASYTLGWITWLAVASTTSIEVMAALQYANNYIPWLQQLQDGVAVLTLPGFGVAVGLLALFSLINVVGIRWFSRLNNLLVWWKLFIIILVIVVFLAIAFSGSNFAEKAEGGFLPYGWEGVFASIATAGIVFSFLGFRQGVELAGETKNPQKNVPIAIIGSLLICALIYVGLQIAFIGALPEGALANGWANIGTSFAGGLSHIAATFGPLAALAGVIGLTWLAVLLYIDAFISPADTALIYTTVTARVSYAMGRNGNSPRSLAKVNERGVPWVSVILTFVAGTIFFLPFPGWQKLVGFVTSATVLSFGSGPLALLAMRRQLPRQARPFRLPWTLLLAYLGFLSASLIVYWSGWDIVWKLMIAVIIGYVILAIHEWRYKGQTPKLEFRSGFWVPVWLAGLTLISWLGEYPAREASAGNIHVLSFGWAILVIAVFSALVMWLAVSFRLPKEKVEKHLMETIEDERPEPVVKPGD